MGLEEITKTKKIQGKLKEENLEGNLEGKINSGYNSAEKNLLRANESGSIAFRLYNGAINIPNKFFNSGYEKIKNTYRFIISDSYRSESVRDYIRSRIYKAEQKGRISTARADYLYGHLDKEKISPYLVDFFVHTAVLNVAGWGPTYILYKYYNAGAISPGDLASLLIFLGSIQRTGWTIGRMVYDCLKKENSRDRMPLKEKIKSVFNKRSIALFAGTWPYVGAPAYLIQMIHSEYRTDRELGEFLLDDSLYGIEKRIPIIRRARKRILNKIYKVPLNTSNYGTNKNNRDKRIK